MESHSKTDTRKGTASKEKKAALAESEEEVEPLSPIHIGSEAPLPSEFEFPDALELRKIESDTQNRLKAILEVAGVTGLSQIDARTFQDPEILRKLTNRSVLKSVFYDCHMTFFLLGDVFCPGVEHSLSL